MRRLILIPLIFVFLSSCNEVVQKAAEEVNAAIAKSDSLGELIDDGQEARLDYFAPGFIILERKKEGDDSLYFVRRNYRSGKKFSEGWYRNDKLDGETHYYRESGQPFCTVAYRRGHEFTVKDGFNLKGEKMNYGSLVHGTGTFKIYDPFTDKPVAMTTFADGLRNGEYDSYYTSGQLYKKGYYKNDTVDGEFRLYFKSGAVREKGTFYAKKLNGEHVIYFRSGRIHSTEMWSHGAPLSSVEYDHWGRVLEEMKVTNPGEYSEVHYDYEYSGELRSRGHYRNRLKHGAYDYMKEGKVVRTETWKNDTLLRETEFYKSGQTMALTVYKNDRKDSIYTEYYSDGKLRLQQGYKDGVKEGIYISYYDNGKVYVKGKYHEGVADGKMDWYSREGKHKGSYTPKEN